MDEVIAELKDLEINLQVGNPDWKVPDPYDFNVYFTMVIGSKGSTAADLFYGQVCSPKWLAKQVSAGRVFFAYRLTIMEKYDYGLLERSVGEYCARCNGSSWDEVVQKLSLIGGWEFDYSKGKLGLPSQFQPSDIKRN